MREREVVSSQLAKTGGYEFVTTEGKQDNFVEASACKNATP